MAETLEKQVEDQRALVGTLRGRRFTLRTEHMPDTTELDIEITIAEAKLRKLENRLGRQQQLART